MNSAHKLYETFTKSTDPKVIVNTANEIKQHFAIVSDKEPRDEIGEEFLYIIGGKNETFEWFLLLIILYLNDDGYNEYFTSLSKYQNLISIKQCEWAILILKEIRPKLENNFIKFCDDLILHLEKTIKEKQANSENIEGDYSIVKDSRNGVAGLWLRDSTLSSNKDIIAMLLMKIDANHLVESALSGNYRIVSNSNDDKGGVYIMFSSELAPGENHSQKFICDICSNYLDSGEGYLLSPKKVLCNAKYWYFFWEKETKRRFKKELSSEEQTTLASSLILSCCNSPYLVCKRCSKMFFFNKIRGRIAAKKWKLNRVPSNNMQLRIRNEKENVMKDAVIKAFAAYDRLREHNSNGFPLIINTTIFIEIPWVDDTVSPEDVKGLKVPMEFIDFADKELHLNGKLNSYVENYKDYIEIKNIKRLKDNERNTFYSNHANSANWKIYYRSTEAGYRYSILVEFK